MGRPFSRRDGVVFLTPSSFLTLRPAALFVALTVRERTHTAPYDGVRAAMASSRSVSSWLRSRARPTAARVWCSLGVYGPSARAIRAPCSRMSSLPAGARWGGERVEDLVEFDGERGAAAIDALVSGGEDGEDGEGDGVHGVAEHR
ncbi:hypothetical protein XF35_25100 [Streptomyces platensis subsp. clarensis]|nr:hypothetical protein [Streptomyces platensis subsp. clarensis]